jgi:ATP-binding protein involved in chromosome partitioning
MFKQVDVPILGVVENMSLFACPNCGHESPIFSHGGAQKTATEMGVAFLGEIPIHLGLRLGGDTGLPYVQEYPFKEHPGDEISKTYHHIATRLLEEIG